MEQTKYDVFISYRRKGGSEKAQLVKSELKQRGVEEERIFLDTHSLHDGDFEQKIKVAIEQSQSVVVIISNGCFDEMKETDFWYMEIKEALQQGKKVVPISFDGITSFANLDVPHDLLELTKKNAVTYQHEYAEAAFDKLIMFIGLQKETHHQTKKQGCLFSLKYKGCLVSVALVSLVVFVLAPITLRQFSSDVSPIEYIIVEDERVCYVPNEDNALECSPEDDRASSATNEDNASECSPEDDRASSATNDVNASKCSPDFYQKQNQHVEAQMSPKDKNEELCGKWQGLDGKLVLSFRTKDVIMEKQDGRIIKTKHGEYEVKGNRIVFYWKGEEKQVVRFAVLVDRLYLDFEDGQMIMLIKR